jgi:hypoxanthine phosphoribosyltransferase
LSFFPAFSSEREIKGRRILVVDDILDTGRTMRAVLAELERCGAAEVRSCVFLDKPARRETPIEPDFSVFEVEDVFVVGYGLDFAGRYRNLPYVGALEPRIYAEHEGRAGV